MSNRERRELSRLEDVGPITYLVFLCTSRIIQTESRWTLPVVPVF